MKSGVFVFSVFLLIALSFSVSAAVYEKCEVKPRANCDSSGEGTILMNLSDSTNAHGEFTTGSGANYPNVLCCNFAASKSCLLDGDDADSEPDNKVMGLSAPTNAHAEIPENNNYATDVCYGNLACISTTSNCGKNDGTLDATNYPINVSSLASPTNSHIGNISAYTTNKICCSISLIEDIYWSDDKFGFNERVTPLSIVPGSSPSVYLVLKNAGLADGTNVSFDIKEDDGDTGDDTIRTVTAKYNASTKKAVATWSISSDDIDAANEILDTENPPYDFYFITNSIQSENLVVDIITADECNSLTSCLSYDESLCDSDPCSRAEAELTQANVSCSTSDCFCLWNATTNKCGAGFFTAAGEDGAIGGLCSYDIDSSIDPDGCESGGIFEYWLNATWNGEPPAPNDCKTKKSSYICPAEIQLPFFDIYNFIITAVLIGLIYLIILRKQKK